MQDAKEEPMLADDEKWYKVSLRFVGDFDPMSIEPLLGLSPTFLTIKGQYRKGKDGREYGPASTNVWSYRVNCSSDVCFTDQIRMFFDTIGESRSALRTISDTNGIEAELFCGFGSGNGQGGDTIPPDILRMMADAGLSLGLDLYPPDINENECEQTVPGNRHPFGTSVMLPADSASRAGSTPEASGDF